MATRFVAGAFQMFPHADDAVISLGGHEPCATRGNILRPVRQSARVTPNDERVVHRLRATRGYFHPQVDIRDKKADGSIEVKHTLVFPSPRPTLDVPLPPEIIVGKHGAAVECPLAKNIVPDGECRLRSAIFYAGKTVDGKYRVPLTIT